VAPIDWRSAQSRGPTSPRYRAADPLPVSSQLRRTFRSSAAAGPSLSEATLVLTVLHHPALLARHLDDFAAIDFTHRELDSLRRLTLELAEDTALDAARLRAVVQERGFGPLLDRLEHSVGGSGAWQALGGADDGDAEMAWLQAVTLHRRSRALHKELTEAEADLAREGTAESLARLIEIQKQLSSAEGMEAVADGFGQSSGRQAREL
jgi:DNA primase